MKRTLLAGISLFFYHLAVSQGNFSTGRATTWCGDTPVTFETSCAMEQPGVQFIHVHENEKTAVEAARKMLEKYGQGCFVTWQSGNDRYVRFQVGNRQYKFDPNRIYTPKGRKETLTANGGYSPEADANVEAVASLFLQNYVDNQRLIVALHNNTDKGGLTINGFKKRGPYARDAKKVFINKQRDEDDFFFTTDPDIYHYIKNKGFNILLQDNERVADDGSLSVYSANKKIPYLNIEAEHGHLQEQLEMIDVVQEMINTPIKH